jgi:peptide/nickel transport system permease protein
MSELERNAGVAAELPTVVAGPAEITGSGGPFKQFVRRLLHNRSAVVALVFLTVAALLVIAAPLIAPYDPLEQDLRATLQSPSGEHWFGTDDLGRDVLSRILFAGRISLLAALEAVVVGVVLGVPFGLLSGYAGGRADTVVMRVTDAVLSFPPLILAIAIVGIRGPGLTNAMIAVGIVFAPRFARLVRGTVRSVTEETFIEASRSIGTSGYRIVVWHVVPNVLSPLIVQVSLAASFAMLAEAGLSFLGLGVQAPDASWGSMLGRALSYINLAPWLVIFPGLCIALTVLALNVFGDGVRDAIGKEQRA